MPLLLDTTRSGSTVELRGRNCLTVGLVNNMPDPAFEATERQFLDLVRAASNDVVVCLKLFSIAEVPRAAPARQKLEARYRDIAELWDMPLDGLIVTGTEPRAPRLEDEPYWPVLTKLVDWARENTVSTVWSCLAAHAAALHLNGVVRRPLEDKLSGVFDCEAVADHPLLANVTPRLSVPHSRANDLPESPLVACGYRVLTRSAAAGVDAFVSADADPSLFLFFQGHPEYDADSLLREYRRDIGRFLDGVRDRYPQAPHGYFSEPATALADAFGARAIAERRAGLIADFPMDELLAGAQNSWRGAARGVYRNWIDYLKDRKTKQRMSAAFARHSRGGARRLSAG